MFFRGTNRIDLRNGLPIYCWSHALLLSRFIRRADVVSRMSRQISSILRCSVATRYHKQDEFVWTPSVTNVNIPVIIFFLLIVDILNFNLSVAAA